MACNTRYNVLFRRWVLAHYSNERMNFFSLRLQIVHLMISKKYKLIFFLAFCFLLELRHPDGFVSDCLYDDLGEGSGASLIPFLNGSRC